MTFRSKWENTVINIRWVRLTLQQWLKICHRTNKLLIKKTHMLWLVQSLLSTTVSVSPPPFCWRDNLQFQILKRGWSEKNECLGGLNKSLPRIFAWGTYFVSCQKRLCKMKYGFEGSILSILTCFSQITNCCLVLWHSGSVKQLE